ncbi:MAG: phage late control D family protein [Lachnospiraceae bacterium]|nr:phage late control D family protein [Lachnospiraceae bacterium]
MATHKYLDLKKKYDNFEYPLVVLTINGKEFGKNRSDFLVSDIEVELTSGYEASIATFCLYNTFEHHTSEFRTEEVKDYILLGSSVELAMGYGMQAQMVFCGFISRVNFFYESGEMPGIRVTAMDVKGVMMANKYSRQLTATSFGEAVKEILNKGPYMAMTGSGLIKNVVISDTPDKTMNTAATSKASDRTIEMVAESDYEFVVKAAKKYNYEFFSECGNVYFRKAKQNAETVMEMGPAEGMKNFDVEYDVTGLVETIKARSTDVSKAKVIEASQKLKHKISMGNKAKKLIKNSEKIYLDSTITSKEEAQYRVESLMEEISYRFGTLECDCIGIPELMPGKFLVLKSLGEPVDNKFYLEKVVHRMNDMRGFETTIYGKASGIGE